MDLAALEFPAIVDRLAAATGTPLGEELALRLEPSAEQNEVRRRQALTAEAVTLLDASAEPPFEGIRDVRASVELASRGGVLNPEALRAVASTVGGGLRVRSALGEEIGRAIEEDGSDVRDTASPLLRKLRKELRDTRVRVTEELQRLARRPGLREHLQEDFVAQRGGRPVFAVKSSSRRSVQGIVHDISDSGQTLFVEPLEVVELSNRLSEASGAEREEVARILRELSAAVGARTGELVA